MTLDESRLNGYANMLRPLGNLEQALFNQSTTVDAVTSDIYTLNFEHGRLRMTLNMRSGKIDALTLESGR